MWIDPATMEVARTHSDVRALRPNWSAPATMTDEMVLDAGFVLVQLTSVIFNPDTQKAVEQVPQLINGVYTQAWVVVSLTPEEQDAVYKAKVPQELTRRQALQILRIAGFTKAMLIAKIEELYANEPIKRDLAIIELEESQVFERRRALTLFMGAALGLNEAGVDNLFIEGSKL